MILAVDVHYRNEFAKVVAIEFHQWTNKTPDNIIETRVSKIEQYVSGMFYKRELPCILSILKKTNMSDLEAIIVDGYVELDDNGKAGLGKYLYEKLDKEVPIIGVAKKGFAGIDQNVVKVFRGESANPLFVTSIGVDLHESADKVRNMAGKYRMPDLLRILDQKTKE